MRKRSSRGKQGPEDINEIAYRVISEATGEVPANDEAEKKNPAAVDLGRMGGRVGGRARAAKLSAEERSEIAKKAAAARWRR